MCWVLEVTLARWKGCWDHESRSGNSGWHASCPSVIGTGSKHLQRRQVLCSSHGVGKLCARMCLLLPNSRLTCDVSCLSHMSSMYFCYLLEEDTSPGCFSCFLYCSPSTESRVLSSYCVLCAVLLIAVYLGSGFGEDCWFLLHHPRIHLLYLSFLKKMLRT